MVRERDRAKERLERDPSRWIIASGRNEVVPDGMAGGNSPFAEQLLNLLENYADSGLTTLSLIDRVTENVTYNSSQTPIGQPLHGVGHQGGQFVFYPQKNERQDWEKALQKGTHEALAHFLENYPKSTYADKAAWKIACKHDTKSAYRTYIQQQPQGQFRLEAGEKMLVLEDRERFEKAKRQGEGALWLFVNKYPDSVYVAQANEEIKRI